MGTRLGFHFIVYWEVFKEVILFMVAQNHKLTSALLHICFLGKNRYTLTEQNCKLNLVINVIQIFFDFV